MVAGQRTPSCRLRALGDSLKCLILLLKHTSAVTKAYLQTADTHSPKPSYSTSGLREHLLEKHKSKPEIHKRLMPRESLGAPQSSRDLTGLTEKTQISEV